MFKVFIGSYSLAVGEIGKSTGRPPIVIEFSTAEAAMRYLYEAIESDRYHIPHEGQSFLIETPSGCKLPLDSLYEETFKERPDYQQNQPTQYPRLFSKPKRRKSLDIAP